jgi:hypothetical protein
MAGVEAPWPAMGVLLGEGREDEEEGEGVGLTMGAARGRRTAARRHWAAALYVVPCCT